MQILILIVSYTFILNPRLINILPQFLINPAKHLLQHININNNILLLHSLLFQIFIYFLCSFSLCCNFPPDQTYETYNNCIDEVNIESSWIYCFVEFAENWMIFYCWIDIAIVAEWKLILVLFVLVSEPIINLFYHGIILYLVICYYLSNTFGRSYWFLILRTIKITILILQIFDNTNTNLISFFLNFLTNLAPAINKAKASMTVHIDSTLSMLRT